ncbi:16071_t:CDS:2 [Gigaspora margarita]|uniref:16071_t:CDS:1 n=1 Tax=Gigaspora margarita TaxID=4874 RepID=A0ABM8VWB9_GIGMA|nr:16071_t:CDS:2 [Gigaspora margarita]
MNGKTLPPYTTQALIVEYKKKLEKTNINYNKANLLKSKIINVIESAQLGSTMLTSAKQYFLLVLTQPCCGCNNNSLKNKILNLTIVEFQIKSTIECQQYDTIFEHTNETQDINLIKAVAVLELAEEISYNAVQNYGNYKSNKQ